MKKTAVFFYLLTGNDTIDIIFSMKLREYIYTYPRGYRMRARKVIAEAIGVSDITVKAWELGLRRPNERHLFALEIVTDGKVTKDEMRPDVYKNAEKENIINIGLGMKDGKLEVEMD